MKEKDKLMIEIKSLNDTHSVNYIDAIIVGNTIIPGLNGLEINNNKSYNNMKNLNVFNEYYIEYNQVKPSVSLKDNLDKTIIMGNKNKKSVSFIVKNNDEITSYLKSLGYNLEIKNICILDFTNTCKTNELKVKASIIINHQNILLQKSKIESGSIILIEENVSKNEIDLLIDEIKYHDLKIINLNELISEENNIK